MQPADLRPILHSQHTPQNQPEGSIFNRRHGVIVQSAATTNTRNGYRTRGWDTRAGSIELAIPKLRHGSYFPDWLLEHRRRAEAALVTVVATSYLLGVSTRRMEKLVSTLGIDRLSKSQVSEMAKDLDGQVEAFRSRPLDAGPYTFLAADALVLKVREAGRTINVHTLIATAVGAVYRSWPMSGCSWQVASRVVVFEFPADVRGVVS